MGAIREVAKNSELDPKILYGDGTQFQKDPWLKPSTCLVFIEEWLDENLS